MSHGVGIIGAGPGAASLHAPTLAGIDAFELKHVSDSGSGRAAAVAAPRSARSSSGIEELLGDPEVDVVAICSPPQLHAEQIIAAVAAGKRAIFCEKPLALDVADAERAIEACRLAGVALVVGTNHYFDPSWAQAKHHLIAIGGQVQTISITASLPANDRYHRLVSEPATGESPPGQRGQGPDLKNADIAAAVVRQLILGLVIHDLPTIRDLAPTIDHLVFARAVPPIGCSLGWRSGDVAVQFSAAMVGEGADALWRMSIGTSSDHLDVEFTPSFVGAGGARVSVRDVAGRVTTFPVSDINGYQAEWLALAELIDTGQPVEYEELLADARFAIELADVATAFIGGAGKR